MWNITKILRKIKLCLFQEFLASLLILPISNVALMVPIKQFITTNVSKKTFIWYTSPEKNTKFSVFYSFKNWRRFNSQRRLILYILTLGDLELYSSVLIFLSSGHKVYIRHFDGLNAAACRFSVMIFHFEGIAGFSGFLFLNKILNISLTAGFQNVQPR